MALTLINASTYKGWTEGYIERDIVETVWTLAPAFILFWVCVPRLILLYQRDEVARIDFRLNVIGHQWFWEYSLPDIGGNSWERYIKSRDEVRSRNIDVDNRCWIPWGVGGRILVTRRDVLHAWSIRRIGIKIDAVPGRINQICLEVSRPGLFYGHCSELCGVNHSFMPICLEVGVYRPILYIGPNPITFFCQAV